MKVTDKQFYMENELIKKFDFMFERQGKNFDHLLIIDGEVGYGKTTLAASIGYYLAQKTGKTFTQEKNIFFDANEMMKFSSKNTREIIMWDEAAFAAMSTMWQNKLQQKLIMHLMTARFRCHFWIFLIPELDKLKDYFISRASGVIHVYSKDDITRGNYLYLNKKKKEAIRHRIKQRQRYSYKNFQSFYGSWSHKLNDIIDEDAYEERKISAIMKSTAGLEKTSVYKERYDELKVKMGRLYQGLKKKYKISQLEIEELSGINQMYVSDCNKAARAFFKTKEQGTIITTGSVS